MSGDQSKRSLRGGRPLSARRSGGPTEPGASDGPTEPGGSDGREPATGGVPQAVETGPGQEHGHADGRAAASVAPWTTPAARVVAVDVRPASPFNARGMTATVDGPAPQAAEARIFEEGYRRYDGARKGEAAAVRSLWVHTIQRIMGLRRSARHKVLPFLSVVIAYLPAIAFIGILSLLPADRTRDFIPTYPQYYGFISGAILFFVVFSAPEALCPDRRYRSLSLYLASPLNRDTYLLAKAAALGTVLTFVTTGPQLLLLAGYVLESHGPHGPQGVLLMFVRILGAGLSMAAFYTAFVLALSSVTDRRGLATGASLIVLAGSQAVTGALVFGFGLPKALLLFNLTLAPLELAERILGGHREQLALPGTSTAVVALGCLIWTVIGAVAVWARYQRLQVTR